ncbi:MULTISPECIES: hypothetical protein [unclassified Neisseria]|uniref:hypothetical protein n=1 Tax=unclassified Neisseria TaxID=2623750 RepID=UPI002665B886|nr:MULTISPECIES: hypothetical protein [unclassified Neisseria]MDO1510071.1 hypothetical protein [Neisseria sp. MVDL19-042950]MDO1516899.1 hypothetical protein [Neisseria sp. MVDL18-041461]MDO1564184.1 hypothetical protein [Neisseria sp. MVDL20-010259]
MRKIFVPLIIFPFLLTACASKVGNQQSVSAAAASYQAGKPEHRIRKIVYSVTEQSNAQNAQTYEQTDKFSLTSKNLLRKVSTAKGKPKVESLILMNHWELDWKMDNNAFRSENVDLRPSPAYWSTNGENIYNSSTLVDANGQLAWREYCQLGAADNAAKLHKNLKGQIQLANCNALLSNEEGTLRIVQNFQGYYLPSYQMFIPKILVVNNNANGRIDKIEYTVKSVH